MNAAFEGAEVPADEALVSRITCDEKDCAVQASAVTGDADVLVTVNILDLPAASVEPCGIVVLHPDEFLTELYHRRPREIQRQLSATQLHDASAGLIDSLLVCRSTPAPFGRSEAYTWTSSASRCALVSVGQIQSPHTKGHAAPP